MVSDEIIADLIEGNLDFTSSSSRSTPGPQDIKQSLSPQLLHELSNFFEKPH